MLWNMQVRCLEEQALAYQISCVSNKLGDINTICRTGDDWMLLHTCKYGTLTLDAEIALFVIQSSCYLTAEYEVLSALMSTVL